MEFCTPVVGLDCSSTVPLMTTDPDVSLATAAAIALGAMKGTALLRQLSVDLGIDKPPPQMKQLVATAMVVGGTWFTQRGARSRVLTASAAVGMASIFHTMERAFRVRGDLDNVAIWQALGKPTGRR